MHIIMLIDFSFHVVRQMWQVTLFWNGSLSGADYAKSLRYVTSSKRSLEHTKQASDKLTCILKKTIYTKKAQTGIILVVKVSSIGCRGNRVVHEEDVLDADVLDSELRLCPFSLDVVARMNV